MQKIMVVSLLLAILNFSLYSASSHATRTPLKYHPKYGVYTANIDIMNHMTQHAETIIDTGSSLLVFVGDKKFCPSCKNIVTHGVINPQNFHKLQSSPIQIKYGSATDQALLYSALIKYASSPPVNLIVAVLLKSSQPSNILGLLPSNFDKQTTSFLHKVTNHFNLAHELTVVLCANKGDSYFHIGPVVLPKPIFVAQLLESYYYEITTFGFYDEKNQPIFKIDRTAIVDTGTGGFIILTTTLHKAIVNYIHGHVGSKNKHLPKKFWNKNYCILKTMVDFSTLPTVKIAFKNELSPEPSYLVLPGTAYFNNAGCEEGYVRMVFATGLPSSHPLAHSKTNITKTLKRLPSMIIGTALLNDYSFKVDYKNKTLSFYDNKTICLKNPEKE